ncbi:hypothetical protein D3C73_1533700 [compost metagenome]
MLRALSLPVIILPIPFALSTKVLQAILAPTGNDSIKPKSTCAVSGILKLGPTPMVPSLPTFKLNSIAFPLRKA